MGTHANSLCNTVLHLWTGNDVISICIKGVFSVPHLPFLLSGYVQGKGQNCDDVHHVSWLNVRKWCSLPVILEDGLYWLLGKWSNGETFVQSQISRLLHDVDLEIVRNYCLWKECKVKQKWQKMVSLKVHKTSKHLPTVMNLWNILHGIHAMFGKAIWPSIIIWVFWIISPSIVILDVH